MDEYRINISSKHIEVTNALHDYVVDKMEKSEKLSNHIIDVDVKLNVHKLNHTCVIILKFSHFKIKVQAVTDDLYSAIDKAFDRLRAKLRKWKGKIQDHHAKGISATEIEVEVLESQLNDDQSMDEEIVDENNSTLDEDFSPPKIVRKKKRKLKTLTVDEAWMKMDLSDDNFMVFRSEEDQGLKVIYRRPDGNYGMFAPE